MIADSKQRGAKTFSYGSGGQEWRFDLDFGTCEKVPVSFSGNLARKNEQPELAQHQSKSGLLKPTKNQVIVAQEIRQQQKSPLGAPGCILDINEANVAEFEKNNLNNVEYDRPILITFGRARCEGCNSLKPVLDVAAVRNKGIDFARAYTDNCPDFVTEYGDTGGEIDHIPYMKLFFRGAEIGIFADPSGSSEQEIIDWVNSQMKGVDKNKIPTPYLDKYTTDMLKAARDGEFEPVVGREKETNALIKALTLQPGVKPGNTSAVLLGESGVGKTTIVQNLAYLLAHEKEELPKNLQTAKEMLPDSLKNAVIYEFQAVNFGAGEVGPIGTWEKNLAGIIKEVKDLKKDGKRVILFMDEIHNAITIGTHSKSDHGLANALLTHIANGDLTIIGATTSALFNKMEAADAAFVRRLQRGKVEVLEPTKEVARAMLEQRAAQLEKRYGFPILNEALDEIMQVADEYLGGHYPNKAIDLLENACKRLDAALVAEPDEIAELKDKINTSERRIISLEKDIKLGRSLNLAQRKSLEDDKKSIAKSTSELKLLEKRWASEKTIVAQMRQVQVELLQSTDEKVDKKAQEQIRSLERQLNKVRNGSPGLASPFLSRDEIKITFAQQTNIPIASMRKDKKRELLNLEERLNKLIFGQPHAIKKIAAGIRVAHTNLKRPNKPAYVGMLLGPTGSGKTASAKALADSHYDGRIVDIKVSTFMEVSEFLNSKELNAIRRNPHCVVVLDEFDQARPEIQNLFYQGFDEGKISDVNLRSAAIFMTSNIASREITEACKDPKNLPDSDRLTDIAKVALEDYLSGRRATGSALLGRMKVIPYYPITESQFQEIVDQKLKYLKEELQQQNPLLDIQFDASVSQAVFANLVDKSNKSTVDTGVRGIENYIDEYIRNIVNDAILNYESDHGDIETMFTAKIKYNSGNVFDANIEVEKNLESELI